MFIFSLEYSRHHVHTEVNTLPLHLLLISLNMATQELSIKTIENKITGITYLKSNFTSNLK